MAVFVIITAAGSGKRMGADINKVFIELDGEPLLARTIRSFQESPVIDSIICVTRAEDRDDLAALIDRYTFSRVREIVIGGAERQDSVYNGLKAIKGARGDDVVLIHNGANPFVDEGTLQACVDEARKHGAAVAGFSARDTIKRVNSEGFVESTLPREGLYQVQTPQAIQYALACEAFSRAAEENFYGTDDVMLVERLGRGVKMIETPRENIKITLPGDMEFAGKLTRNARIGFGIDSHRFLSEDNKKACVMAGVTFDDAPGFEANSDGDVVYHALFNAISQGLGEKSISFYADPLCKKGITDSAQYLTVILDIMRKRGYSIGNIGIMIEGKRPRISGKEEKMTEELSRLTQVPGNAIGITATTGEGLTDFGRGLGVQCYAVVTLKRR